MGWPLAIAIASAVAGTVAKAKQTQSEAQALRNKEALAYLQASELQRRADYNLSLLSQQINVKNQDFLAGFATTTATSKSKQSVGDTLLSNMQAELTRAKMESDYEITMKKAEAQNYGAAASAANKMQTWNLLTGGLSAANSYYSATQK